MVWWGGLVLLLFSPIFFVFCRLTLVGNHSFSLFSLFSLCFGGTLLVRRMDFWWWRRKQGDFLGGRKHQTITHAYHQYPYQPIWNICFEIEFFLIGRKHQTITHCLQLMHTINIQYLHQPIYHIGLDIGFSLGGKDNQPHAVTNLCILSISPPSHT